MLIHSMVQQRRNTMRTNGVVRRCLPLAVAIVCLTVSVCGATASRIRGMKQSPLLANRLLEEGLDSNVFRVDSTKQVDSKAIDELSGKGGKGKGGKGGKGDSKCKLVKKSESLKEKDATSGKGKGKGSKKTTPPDGAMTVPGCEDDPEADGTGSPSPTMNGSTTPSPGKGKGGSPKGPTQTPSASPGNDSPQGSPMTSPGDGGTVGVPTSTPGDGGTVGVPTSTPDDGGNTSAPTLSPVGGSQGTTPSPDGGSQGTTPSPGNSGSTPSPSPGPSSGPSSAPGGTGTSKPTEEPTNAGPSGEPGVENIVDCAAIASGTGTTDADSETYNVDMDLAIQRGFAFSDVADELQLALQKHVAPRVAGCESGGSRRLQDNKILNAVFFKPEADAEATCSPPEGSTDSDCIATDTAAVLFHNGGDTDGFSVILADAIESARDDGLLSVPGLEDIGGIKAEEEINDDSGVAAAVNEARPSDDITGLGIAGIALMSAAAAGMVLIALLVVKRRRDSSDISHVYLEDDMKEIDGDGDTVASSRKTSILPEEDSIASAWTGQKQQGDSLSIYSGTMQATELHDVRTCQTASCAICTPQRKSDQTFVPTGPGTMPRLPTDAVRDYLTEDTVNL